MKIAFIGGGSYGWGPPLLGDLALSALEGSVWLTDLDQVAGERMARLGNMIMAARRAPLSVQFTPRLAEALDGADYVLLSITTGGLEAMRGDLEIPGSYGIYQAVGDTVGPGGISRSLRNIPVVVGLARQMERHCPNAWLLNVTNPMTTLCRAVTAATSIRTIGLCHEVRHLQQRATELLSATEAVERWQVVGVNHLPWVVNLDFAGAQALRAMVEALPPPEADGDPFRDNLRAKLDLLEVYGTFPAAGDRHVVEFFPHYLRTPTEAFERYGVRLTSIGRREANRARDVEDVLAALEGRQPLPAEHSGEQAVPVIESLAGLRSGDEFVVNIVNAGQLVGVPDGPVVECMATVDTAGVHPRAASPLPPPVLTWVRIHVAAQELVVQAALEGRTEPALQAVLLDPLCHRLSSDEAAEMLRALQAHNARFVPPH